MAPELGYEPLQINTVIRWTFMLHGPNNEMIVGIREDGSVEFGPTYTADEACRAFWLTMGRAMPDPKIEIPSTYEDPDTRSWTVDRY